MVRYAYILCLKSFTFTNRCIHLLVLESTKIYIKIPNEMLHYEF